MKRPLSPWYAGLLWNLSMLVQGSLVATLVPTLPVMAVAMAINGVGAPPSGSLLRTVQIVQGIVISMSGGWLTERYFLKRFDCPLEATRRWILRFQVGMLLILVGAAACIATLHYGNPFAEAELAQRVVISVLLLYGSFVPMFIMASRHYWRRFAGSGP